MYLHILTGILVTLRALDYISLSYWWCVAPSLISVAFILFISGAILSFAGLAAWFHRK